MANNSLITQEQYQSDMENLYNNKIKPYLNGASHTGFTPVGTVISYFGETAPTHFLICDGTAYNKADYPQLWTHLSSLTDTTPYVVDGDNTKFKVPDLRGEFLRGTGTNGHTNQGSGANVGVHQDGTEELFTRATSQYAYIDDYTIVDDTKKDSINTTTGSRVLFSGTLENNKVLSPYTSRPTNTSVLFCIAVKDIYIDYALDGFPCEITNPQDKQGLTFDATTQKWVNGAGGLHEYSTTEKVVGTWIDGRPVYECTLSSTNVTISSDDRTWVVLDDTYANAHNLDNLISITSFGYKNSEWIKIPQLDYAYKVGSSAYVGNGILDIMYAPHLTNKPFRLLSYNGIYLSGMNITFIIQYTKTTDTPTVQS